MPEGQLQVLHDPENPVALFQANHAAHIRDLQQTSDSAYALTLCKTLTAPSQCGNVVYMHTKHTSFVLSCHKGTDKHAALLEDFYRI